MTLPEILARLERLEKEASGLVIPEPIGPTCKQFSEEARLDALALSAAREALEAGQEPCLCCREMQPCQDGCSCKLPAPPTEEN